MRDCNDTKQIALCRVGNAIRETCARTASRILLVTAGLKKLKLAETRGV